jgi:ubiquinone/menaquinone biosynthesis C-methylase UbiE
MNVNAMKFHDPESYSVFQELDIIRRLLPLEGARVLELGCGKAEMTRVIAENFPVTEIIATEVDEIQHAKNLAIRDLPQVHFRLGGAQAIDEPDNGFDIVLMLKSLHHVPVDSMDQALAEIRRVLKPEGLAYISEPVFAGDFNEILRLFNDEEAVRRAAFEAVKRAVKSGLLELCEELFFQVPATYPDFETFEDRVIRVSHTRHDLDEAQYLEVRKRFMASMTEQGVSFLKPMRVDLLRKPLSL